MELVHWMTSGRIKNMYGPGINPYSDEWHILATEILNKSPNVIAGDYSGFDSRHTVEAFDGFMILVEMFYHDATAREKEIRRVLFEEIKYSFHIYGKKIYQWVGSLPSGSFLTTLINCILNLNYLMIAYVNLVPDSTFQDFFENVYACVFGDDHILSVRPSKLSQFNGKTIQAFMPNLNQEYTAEDKSPEMYVCKKMEEAGFLKRSFRYEPVLARYVAPLSQTTIDEFPYWYRRTHDPMETVRTNIDRMWLELSLHGEEIFTSMVRARKDKINDLIDYVSPFCLNWQRTLEECIAMDYE